MSIAFAIQLHFPEDNDKNLLLLCKPMHRKLPEVTSSLLLYRNHSSLRVCANFPLMCLIIVIFCTPPLFTPRSGMMTCSNQNIFGSECDYRCQKGHTIHGSAKRVCDAPSNKPPGKWIGNDTTCEGDYLLCKEYFSIACFLKL